MKLLVLGFGSVGSAFLKILPETFQTSICTSHGGIASASIDELKEAAESGTKISGLADFSTMDPMEAVEDWDYDVLVDLSPTNVETAEPSSTYWKTAIERKKHVVTANKGPLAVQYAEMTGMAEDNQVSLLMEATVAGGTPVFNLARHCLNGPGLQRVEGIINGSTNYILTQMERGRDFDDVVIEARSKGYLEADPSADVDGKDALAKAVILANALFGRNARYKDYQPSGIRGVTLEKVNEARGRGNCFKLIARVDAQELSVQLEQIPFTHSLARVTGAWNALTFYTKNADAITISGHGAGGLPTASAVLNDVLELYDHST
ncbi:MAG TPA: homoserine dehydrogenase [Candidatus Norongarragalinales archaeon]|nr:homoserine dehydrogenase [Candidatus Norongarragalinales archaeon]